MQDGAQIARDPGDTQMNEIETLKRARAWPWERLSALPSTMAASRLTAVDRGDNVPSYPQGRRVLNGFDGTKPIIQATLRSPDKSAERDDDNSGIELQDVSGQT
jgi:hypothetical protein